MKQDFCDKEDHNGAVHRCIHAVVHLIEDHAEEAGIPVRFAATKVIEGDHLILNQLKLDENGYICAGEDGVTSAPGVFAAGDIRTKALRQIVTAVSDGANAVASAQKYLWRTDNGNH